MIQKKRTYSWDISIPTPAGTLLSNKVPSRVFDDCDIFISLCTDEDDESEGVEFDISIERTNSIVVSADILLSLTNIKSEKISLIDWEDSFYDFSRWLLPSDCSPEGEYNFVCQITWIFPDPMPRSYFNLHDHLQKFLVNSSYCDVKIVIGTEELHAHKIILASCSTVFDTMLTAPMKEAAENQIIIKDIELDVMKTVLAFLYAREDNALDDLQMALGCLEAAEKYEIQGLKDFCEQKLCKFITAETVIAILRDADTYRAEKLKEECLMFIAENKTKIISTPEFEEIRVAKPHLMVQFVATLNSFIIPSSQEC